jgi:hypothetical protein
MRSVDIWEAGAKYGDGGARDKLDTAREALMKMEDTIDQLLGEIE